MKLVRAVSKAGIVFKPGADGTFRPLAPRKSFDAALQNRLTSDWTVSRLSADAELQGRLPIIRSRSRDLEQNDPHAEAFLKLRENNVVGHDGFTLQMKVKLSEALDPGTGEMVTKYDTAAGRAIEAGWKRFCQRKNFLVTKTMHAIEACKLIERTMNRDGDLLIRKVRGYPNEFGFSLQLLEADYLDDQYLDFRGVECNCPNERRLPNGAPFPRCQRGLHEVRMGVELHGDWKFPVGYWLLANHPGDYFFGNNISPRRIRVPVEDMIHPFVYKRIEQTRGIPAMVASMLRLQMLGGYDEAALVAARAGAQKMGVITKDVPEEMAADFDPGALNGRTIDGAPGEFLELPMGFDIKSIDWNNPTEAYEPFTKAQKRAAAAGLGVSYSSLANDPSDANFSATRIGMLEEREGYRGGQSTFENHVLREIFPDFLEAAMMRGLVDLPFSRFDEFTDEEAVNFHGRSFPWIDPVKDIQAAREAIELGVGTRTEFAAEAGKDFEEVTATLGREKEMREAAGIGEVEEQAPGFDPKTDVVTQRRQHWKKEQTKSWNEVEPPDGEEVWEVTIKTLVAGVEALAAAVDFLHVAKALKGWVTINGAHVLIGDDGTVSKGPAALVEHLNRRNTLTGRARQAVEDAAPETPKKTGKKPPISSTSTTEKPTLNTAHADSANTPAAQPGTATTSGATRAGAERATRDELGRAAGANAEGGLKGSYDRQVEALKALREKSPELAHEPSQERKIAEGAEHHVEQHHADATRVMKHTYDGFGVTLSAQEAPFGAYAGLRQATPQEYIARIDAQNHLFGDDTRIEGITKIGGDADRIGLAVSQRAIQGTEPSAAEMEKFMKSNGFVKVKPKAFDNDYIADKVWFHPKSNHVVADVKPDNFKKDKKGRIVPIDVLVQHAEPGSGLHSALHTQLAA
jgi:lambda family phage portal protein